MAMSLYINKPHEDLEQCRHSEENVSYFNKKHFLQNDGTAQVN